MVIKGPHGEILNLDPDTGELLSAPATREHDGSNSSKATVIPDEASHKNGDKATVTGEKPKYGDLISDSACEGVNTKDMVSPSVHNGNVSSVVIKSDEHTNEMWDQAEAVKLQHMSITSGTHDSMIQILKKLKLKKEHHEPYREWMIKTQKSPEGGNLYEEDIPPVDS